MVLGQCGLLALLAVVSSDDNACFTSWLFSMGSASLLSSLELPAPQNASIDYHPSDHSVSSPGVPSLYSWTLMSMVTTSLRNMRSFTFLRSSLLLANICIEKHPFQINLYALRKSFALLCFRKLDISNYLIAFSLNLAWSRLAWFKRKPV